MIDAVMKSYPQRLINSRGDELRVAEMVQSDRYLPLLTGGVRHPAYEVNNALVSVRNRYDWQGPIVYVPTQLFTGLIPLKSRHEMVNAECAALPPLESVMWLRGPAAGPQEDFREMLVVWFSTDYGIEPWVIEYIQQLDWQSHSQASGY